METFNAPRSTLVSPRSNNDVFHEGSSRRPKRWYCHSSEIIDKVNTHVPILSAPATNMSLQALNERMPPDAFTFTVPLYFTALYIRRTSSLVAPPPVANPVDVLTKAAPASAARTLAATLSPRDGINPVSMMTFTGTCPVEDIIVRRCLKIWV